MKYLGIDYGSKRVGLAVSDPTGKLAFPHSVVESSANLVFEIKNLIEKLGISAIVVGESLNFKGVSNLIQKEIESFVISLKKETKIEIFMELEFLTSKQAELIQGKNEMNDASAAAIILQSFLDKKSV